MMNTSIPFTHRNITVDHTPSMYSNLTTHTMSQSIPEGCTVVKLSELEFLPWNNSQTIVNEEVEVFVRKIRFCMLQALFFIGGPANVINMAVFFKQGLRDRVNLLLFSLSLADELFLIASMLNYGEEYYLEPSRETKAGPLLTFIVNSHLIALRSFSFVSFFLSCIIACERCYCVLRPLKYQTLLKTRTMAFIIIAVYVVVLGLDFVVVLRYSFLCIYDLETGTLSKTLGLGELYLRHKKLIDNVSTIFFGAGLPVGMVTILLPATVITTVKLRQIVAWRTHTSSVTSAKEVMLTKMLIGTSILLIICVTPACLQRIARIFLPEMNTGERNQNIYMMSLWISESFLYINSSFNIFIYYAMGSRYRETFWTLCHRKSGKEKH